MGLKLQAAPAGRIGIFGGAFDPPHNAHVALAEAAVGQLQLDRLHVIPTGHAWHKARALSPAADRLEMARLAFGELKKVTVDSREINREGPTFTIDTLEAIQHENPGAQLHLVIGADQYTAFSGWHRFADILKIAIICIADRAHSAGLADHSDAKNLPGATIRRLILPLMAVSATQVRQLAAQAASTGPAPLEPPESAIAQLVPPAIARYISSHRLYRAN
ncbi:MAG: nicotinate (nicotinamide) nucleotide adenylyltransferase [Comamonadaceae bacterium]|nr:MAG: nicotinate (nicotinamide) nucleotide adenylyltransferase [Comamonadaceae bacterium]